ncbi:MAG: serine/threonine protein kinase [Myxococcales bacterium]|nr:serine/threonine protein kinase [Myxococcales bacterium]
MISAERSSPAGVSWASNAELAADAARLQFAARLAVFIWIAYVGTDLLLAHYLYHPPLAPIVVIRIAGVAVLVGPYLLGLGRPTTVRGMTILSGFICAAIAALIGAVAAYLGGPGSPYTIGVAYPLAGLAMLQRHWRNNLLPAIATSLAFAAGQLFAPPSPGLAIRGDAALAFAVTMVAALGLSGFSLLLSHQGWMLRRQVFESRSIGRYRLRRRLGKGGMGEVWSAFHATLGRDVAVKILRPERSDPDMIARFEREVRATTMLSHPNTVRVFDYGVTDDGLWYYAMELLDGANLRHLVEHEGRLPAARAVHLVTQAARALGEAHRAGLVHRDLKPENLLITQAGGELDFVKVIDFGIARHATDVGVTRVGEVAGTPQYIAPEVASGAAADARADVYALGAVLYYLLTGAPPFGGETPAALLLAAVNEPVVPPSLRAPDVPRDVEQLVLACLAKAPDQRPADGAALATALATLACAGTWHPTQPPPPIGEAALAPTGLATNAPTVV